MPSDSRLSQLIQRATTLLSVEKYDPAEMAGIVAGGTATVVRLSGPHSEYTRRCRALDFTGGNVGWHAKMMLGILRELSDDVAAGMLASHRELLHGEVFGDFLEMAEHLLEEGYKDAAAVIAGSALEAHLRALCEKLGVETTVTKDDRIVPKKADRLNGDLVNAAAYGKLDHKSITAWLNLRNDAAHGHYEKYEATQVRTAVMGIRDFITRVPA